jgi:hypothetical protein
MKLSKAQREQLKMKFGGCCAYCGCVLSAKWQADHVEPINRKMEYRQVNVNDPWNRRLVATNECYYPERDTYENLVPSCPQCNNYKHAMGLETFRQALGRQIEMLREYSANFRTAERYGLVVAREKPIVFWFERYTDLPPATSECCDSTEIDGARKN